VYETTTFILGGYPFNVVYKIWILNLRDSNKVFGWQYDFKWKKL
jgi:hypothetical protein